MPVTYITHWYASVCLYTGAPVVSPWRILKAVNLSTFSIYSDCWILTICMSLSMRQIYSQQSPASVSEQEGLHIVDNPLPNIIFHTSSPQYFYALWVWSIFLSTQSPTCLLCGWKFTCILRFSNILELVDDCSYIYYTIPNFFG